MTSILDKKARVVVLISGRGSNMVSLFEAAQQTDYPAEIALVASDKADAKGLEWASKQGLETAVLDYQDKASAEAELDKLLTARGIDFVCLAGFMRLLSPWFIRRWLGKVINIHPSLLPAFPGAHAHRDAIIARVRVSGCTCHFVDAGMDTGAIIDQRSVHLTCKESEESLATKVLELEHALYPECLARVAAYKVQLIDGKAVWR